MPAATAEAPGVVLSFANNFWGKDDAGVGPLLERMLGSKQTCDELKSFYGTRASIEDEYSRKLLNLSKKSLGALESGTLKTSLDTVRGELEAMAKQHQNIAAQMKTELEEPLAAFAGGIKERRKIVQNTVEKLLKVKVQQTNQVNKTRDKYEQECLKIKGYLAQGHMVMGQEERRNKAKLEKTQISLATTNTEYENAVKALEETTVRWNREWKAAADKFQDLEEERLDFTKSSLWTFANIASTVCVSDDASCEKIRLSLENMDVETDIVSFINEQGTGQEIPEAPKYINFCRGDINDSTSEVSEDENYTVAQFPRSINPAFRSSSPQPSTFESHHDPNSALANNLAHRSPAKPVSREATVTPQKTPQKSMQHGRPSLEDQYRKPQPLAVEDTYRKQSSLAIEDQYGKPQPLAVEDQYRKPQPLAVEDQYRKPQPLVVEDTHRKQHPPAAEDAYRKQQPLAVEDIYRKQQPLALEDQYRKHPSPAAVEQHRKQPTAPVDQYRRQQPAVEDQYHRQQPSDDPYRRHSSTAEDQHRRPPTAGQPPLSYDVLQHGPVAAIPHDPYPKDGMTMLCRPGPASDRSSQLSQPASARPSSRDSHSEYSNPTSLESQELSSGTQSPIKQEPAPAPSPEKRVLKKRSGFFQNHSPFRRKSTKDLQAAAAASSPSNRNTWHPSQSQAQVPALAPVQTQAQPQAHTQAKVQAQAQAQAQPQTQTSASGGAARRPQTYSNNEPQSRNLLQARTASPEPIDANASLALGVGQNVLPVTDTSPRKAQPPTQKIGQHDPIAAALAELKNVNLGKQSSVRMSADHYHGIATPAPPSEAATPRPFQAPVSQEAAAATRGTPPPSYQAQTAQARVTRLGVPPPAVTSRAMKEATQKATTQTRSMFNDDGRRGSVSGGASPVSRPGTRGSDMPRSASPAPTRSASPQPQRRMSNDPRRTDQRSVSPNPYHDHHRNSSQTSFSQKRPSDQGNYRQSSPHGSTRGSTRGASPSPYRGHSHSQSRPQSSYSGSEMAVQLAPVGDDRYGSTRSRGSGRPESRAMGLYDGGHQRSNSVADPSRQYSQDGRPILHMARAMYMYQAAIPEELGFAKGDYLTVYRHQDDGWWEAEVHNGSGQVGLVPSNYLQPC